MWVFYIWFRLGFRFHWEKSYTVEPLLLGTRFLQGQISLPFSIYNVITGSNQSPWFDLQGFYRVKSVSLFRFTRFLQGQRQSPFFDLQCYYKVKSVTRFRFTRFLQGQISLSSSIYKVFTGSNQSPFFDFRNFYNVEWFHPFSIYTVFT